MAGEMNQAQVGRQQVTQQFGQNPVKFMHDKLKDPIERMVQERVSKALEDRFGQFQESQVVDSWEKRLSPFIYQQDANGRTLTDPATGQVAFTPYGQNLQQTVSWFRSKMPQASADDVMEAALAVAGQPGAQAQQSPAQPSAPAAAPAAPAGHPANGGFWQDQTGGWHRPNGDFASAAEIQGLAPRTFVQNAQAMAQQYNGGGYNQNSLLDTDPDASMAGAESLFLRHGAAILSGAQAR
jgi:hypothetical protein